MRRKTMGVSTAKVLVISTFLIIGMVLAGVLMQPKTSLDAWNVKESDFPANASPEEKLTFLLRYAILAPSSYNTQPWNFNISGNEIDIFADKSGWLQVADTDQRELYLSLGCCLENLRVSADHFGYNCSVTYFPGPKDLVARVILQPGAGPSLDPRLFSAISSRLTNRNLYEEKAIKDADLITLRSFGSDENVRTSLVTDSTTKKKFLDLNVRADQIQYSDANFKSELGHWLSQGVMGPTGIQAKIDQMEVVFLDNGPDKIRMDSELINSTPYLGFISSNGNDSKSQVMAGETLERLWLAATALGVSLHPMSQALEVQETKKELDGLMPVEAGSTQHVQQTFRLGYAGPVKEHTPRRPLEDVLIKE
jgi:nitroreductase